MTASAGSLSRQPVHPDSASRGSPNTSTANSEQTASIGMTVFLGAWVMLFAALFFAYGVLRTRAISWPPTDLPTLSWHLPALATAFLVLSSLCLISTRRVATIGAALTGAGFLATQLFTWNALRSAGLEPSSGQYATAVFGLTWIHAAHAAIGVAGLSYAAISNQSGRWKQYWHLVGIVWLLLVLTVFAW